MQSGFNSSQTWAQNILHVLAAGGFLGIIGAVYKGIVLYLNRNKPKTEIHLSEAQTDKTRAEARRIRVQADTEFSATFERLHARIDQMQEEASKCHAERDEYKMRMDLQAIELKMRGEDVKRLQAENVLLKGDRDALMEELSDLRIKYEPKE